MGTSTTHWEGLVVFENNLRLVSTMKEKTDDYWLLLVSDQWSPFSLQITASSCGGDFSRALTFSHLARSLVWSPNPRGPNLHPSSFQVTSKLPKSRQFGLMGCLGCSTKQPDEKSTCQPYLRNTCRSRMSQTRSNSETKEDEIGVLETKPGLVGRIEELCQGSFCDHDQH